MKDIPADGIYYDDAMVIVFRLLNPDTWEILEERLSPASRYYAAFPERDAKVAARAEAERAYYDALRLADEWLQERIGRGILDALRRDPNTGEKLKAHHSSMGDFFTRITDDLAGGRPPIFFERESFESAVKEIAQRTAGIGKPPAIKLEPKTKLPPQRERAERYIQKHFPHGVDDGITTAAIYKTLANDKDLKAELGGRAIPSTTLINRVLGRREK